MRARSLVPTLSVAVIVAAMGSAACRRSATREWRPDDHDQESPNAGQAAPSGSGAAPNDDRALIEAAWSSNCVVCHGRMGQGDGPQGPMVKAPNLTDPALVDKLTDAELAAIIKGGRNKMPAFPSLPDRIVGGLVQRIRALEAK